MLSDKAKILNDKFNFVIIDSLKCDSIFNKPDYMSTISILQKNGMKK